MENKNYKRMAKASESCSYKVCSIKVPNRSRNGSQIAQKTTLRVKSVLWEFFKTFLSSIWICHPVVSRLSFVVFSEFPIPTKSHIPAYTVRVTIVVSIVLSSIYTKAMLFHLLVFCVHPASSCSRPNIFALHYR